MWAVLKFGNVFVIILVMKKLSKLLSKKFNELHLLAEQSESVDALKIVEQGIEELQTVLNQRTEQIKNYVTPAVAENLLDRCLNYAFPDYKAIKNTLENMKKEDKKVKNVYTEQYLPFHTRDNAWLARYLRAANYRWQTSKNAFLLEMGKAPNELQEISLVDIENYLENSKQFSNMRDRYEQRFVESLFLNDVMNTKEDSAVWFRRGIMGKVKEIGIDEHNAGVIMEKNTRWREKIYKNAFRNFIEHRTLSLLVPNEQQRQWLKENHFTALVGLEMVEKEAFQCFRACEEYEYFQCKEPQAIILELHAVTDNMRLTRSMVNEMRDVKMKALCDKYAQELRICKNIMKREQGRETE